MPLQTMRWFAEPALGFDLSTGLQTGTLPGDGTVTYKGTPYCYQLYPQECLEMVNQFLNPHTQDMTLDRMNIVQVQ